MVFVIGQMPVLGHSRSTVCNVLASPRQNLKTRSQPAVLTTFTGFRSTLSLGSSSSVPVPASLSARGRRGCRSVNRRKETKMMFERFTEKAIKVVMLAQEEARRLGHNFVGTEQILLGLIGESTGIAAKVTLSPRLKSWACLKHDLPNPGTSVVVR